MANTFVEKVQKFVPILDEVYAHASKTAILEDTAALWVGTNKVRMPKIEMDGAADYDRTDGYVKGGISVDYGEYTLEYDRGRSFQIDWVDNDETGFDAFRTAALEYVRTKEVPEVDAVRFSKIASLAGTVTTLDPASFDAVAIFEAARVILTNAEVAEENRIAFVSPAFMSNLKAKLGEKGRYELQANDQMFDFRVMMLDGVPLIEVPSARLWDAIQLNDGVTAGEEAGGFAPISGTSKAIHLIYGDRSAMKAYTKRYASKIFTPETNIFADAFLVQYRNHHDLMVPENKVNGIYVVTSNAAFAG